MPDAFSEKASGRKLFFMMQQMVFDKAGDEIIAVIIARMAAQA
jgi:hypothetical protein